MYESIQQGSLSNGNMEKVQMFLTGRNFMDLDVFSKSDPYVRVFFRSDPQKPLVSLGRTQTVQNDLNPNFRASFILDYIFEIKQQLVFKVYDEDDSANQKNDDFIGEATTTLGALTGAKNQTTILDLKNSKTNKNPGKLIVRIEPCSDNNEFFQMKWRAEKLLNTDSWFDWWDKSDPYLKFCKIRNDNTFLQVGRTETIQNNLNPNWNMIELSNAKLFSKNSQDCRVKVQCWDWQAEGEAKHQFIGEVYIDFNILKNSQIPMTIPLFNSKHKNPGTLILEQFKSIVRPCFVDYLRGGLELNLSVCIDFTGSNGIPTQPSSLHYFSANQPNQYQMAIQSVCQILLDYDSDKKIPAFGFGAKTKYRHLNSYQVSHCFPLSGNVNEIQAFGKQHLMQLYNYARSNVQLSGPTLFLPLLKEAFKSASISAQNGSKVYQILLILTDGQIHDMEQTIDFIVQNSNLPLSIIIVGVGNADFTNMVRLDGDNGLYNSNGKKAPRDIVQFVPFREMNMNPQLLARELLAELPSQVTQYMSMIGKPPGNYQKIQIQELLRQNVEQKGVQKEIAKKLTGIILPPIILPPQSKH